MTSISTCPVPNHAISQLPSTTNFTFNNAYNIALAYSRAYYNTTLTHMYDDELKRTLGYNKNTTL